MAIHEALLGPRVEDFYVDLLDAQDNRLGPLNGVTGGKVEQNADRVIRGGFKLDLVDTGQGINWMQHRFQPWIVVNGLKWPLGVFLPSSPDDNYTATGKRWSASCVDKLVILDESATPTTYGLPEGVNLVDTAVAIISAFTGETSVLITPSAATSRYPITWEAGTTVLRMVNDLLSAANYFSCWADGYGRFRMEPYIKPQDREPVAEFIEGQSAIHLPVLSRMQNISDVPNQVIVVTQGTDEVEGMSASAENTDPGSPYSYEARGNRWVTRVYTGAEVADQATLQELASRYLRGADNPVANYKVTHAAVPLNPNDVVRLVHQDIEVNASVNEYTLSLEAGSLMTGLWTEVNMPEGNIPEASV